MYLAKPTVRVVHSASANLLTSVALRRSRPSEAFAVKWKTRYPSAVACLVDDLESLTVHLRFPTEHWRRIRHSNFIERTFGETRRRVKVIGRLPGEATCVSLVWAVLDRASRGWRGVTMTPAAIRRLHNMRRDLFPTRHCRQPRR